MPSLIAAVLLSVSMGQGDARTFEVPFRIIDGSLCIQIKVNGEKNWFLLDSGAVSSSIDPKVAARLGAERTQERNLIAGVYVPSSIAKSVLVGKVQFSRQSFAHVSKDAGRRDGHQVVGLLGCDVLAKLTVAIDFRECRAWVWDNSGEAKGKREFWKETKPEIFCNLDRDSWNRPKIVTRVCGKKIDAVLDLGSYLSILDNDDWRPIRAQVAMGSPRELKMMSGRSKMPIGLASTIQVNNATWAYAPVWVVADEGIGTALGWTLFPANGKVLFDFRKRLILVPKAKSFSTLETALGIYGARVLGNELELRQGNRLRLKDFRSFFGFKIAGGRPLNDPSFWSPRKTSVDSILDMYYPTKAECEFVYKGRLTSGFLDPVEKPIRAKA